MARAKFERGNRSASQHVDSTRPVDGAAAAYAGFDPVVVDVLEHDPPLD